MALTSAQQNDLFKLTVGLFNAAPGAFYTEVEGILVGSQTPAAAAQVLIGTPAFQAILPSQILTNNQFATKFLDMLVGSTVSAANKAWAVAQMEGQLNNGETQGAVAWWAIDELSKVPTSNADWGTAATLLNNKLEVTKHFTVDQYVASKDIAVLQGLLIDVTADVGTVAVAKTAGTNSINLSTAVATTQGTAGADTFKAFLANGENTLQSGDVIRGGAGNDTLLADISTNSYNGTGVTSENAIAFETSSVETIKLRSQHSADANNNGDNNLENAEVAVDAERAANVGTWHNFNSRADLIIEDVRIADGAKTKDVTLIMESTDPGNVDFGVYFDQHSLRNSGTGTTTLTIKLMDTGAAGNAATAATPLLNNPYDQFKLGLNGVLTTIQLDKAAVAAADTYAALLTVFQNALASTAGVTVALGNDFTITDPISNTSVTGKEIVLTGSQGITISSMAGSGWYNTTGAAVPPTSNIYTTYADSATSTTELVTSTIVLDDVGRGSTGGDLLVGGLSVGETSTSRGVERFEIEVRDSSKLQTINSTNNALREVVITSGNTSNTVNNTGAYTTVVANEGDLTVNGNAKNALGADQGTNSNGNQEMDGADENSPEGVHQGANAAGFTDVRLIDASAFKGKLAFTAAITSDSITKYVNLADHQADPAGDVAGTGNVNFNVKGANFIYTGGNDNDTMTVTIDAAAAASRSTVVSGQSDMTFNLQGGDGNDTIQVNVNTSTVLNGNLQNWYNNQDLNNNITINGGAGDDVIRVPGAGDTTIDAGTGNDTVWADNTGSQAGLNVGGGVSVTSLANGTSSNGVWVFNTYDQANAVANGAARNIYDIRSDVNDTYNLYKATLTVSFKGLISSTITLTNATTYKTTDLEINQAIKNAINNNDTLKKLIVAQDGPGNSLIVTSLVDGVMNTTDLSVTLAAPASTGSGALTTAEETAARTAWGLAAAADVYAPMATEITRFGTTNADYTTQMAQDAVGTNIVGAASTSTSDNFITPGEGNDVIVLGTTESVQDVGRSSNDVVVLGANFGNDVIVNFDNTGNGVDHINLYTFLNSDTGVTLAGSSVAANNFNATKSVINMMQEVTGTGATANDSAAKVQALYRAAADTAASAASINSVVIVVNNTTNVGTVYSIVNGTAANDATATLQGTINLGDLAGSTASTWSTIGVENFRVPVVNSSVATGVTTITSEGPNTELVGTTMTAIANNQILVGTANIDTLDASTFTGVTMTGNGSGDTFKVAAAGSTTITDLTTGDAIQSVNGTVTANNVSAFVADANTSHTTGAVVTINAAFAGSTINLAAATGTEGYTLNGGAGNDTLTGSAFDDTLTSGATGTDVLNGGAGDDTMSSGGGTVTFNGGTGANTITADAGVDTINTVSGGIDTVTAFATAGADVITVAAGGIANVTSGAAWTATASSSNSGQLNFTSGAAGAYDFSLMTGSAGVTFTGSGAGIETVTGTARADSITVAAANADIVIGGQGNDTIDLTGAVAADTVRYAAGDGTDLIQNFTATADVFDYTSALVATDGATAITAAAINGGGIVQVAAAGAVTLVSAAAATVGLFEFSGGGAVALSVDFASASTAAIQTAAEAMLAANTFAVGTAPLTNGAANTDVLFVIYEAAAQGASTDAAIFRYQEGSTAEASFSGELTLVGVLTGIAQDALVIGDFA